MQEKSWMDDETFQVTRANGLERVELLELFTKIIKEKENARLLRDDLTIARKSGQIQWIEKRLGVLKEQERIARRQKVEKPIKEDRRKNFFDFFFRAAEHSLPFNIFKEIVADAKERALDYQRDTMPDHDEYESKEALILVLRPILMDLVNKYGVERARIIFKEAAAKAGVDPDKVDLRVEKSS